MVAVKSCVVASKLRGCCEKWYRSVNIGVLMRTKFCGCEKPVDR
jgi:hypothetical protein